MVSGTIAGLGMLLLTILVTAHVAARRFLESPFVFTEEYSGYLQVLIVFFGLAYTLRVGGHITLDLLVERLPMGLRRHVTIVTTVVGLLFIIVLAFSALLFVSDSFQKGTIAPTPRMTPLWIPQAVVLLGLVLLAVQLGLEAILQTRARERLDER